MKALWTWLKDGKRLWLLGLAAALCIAVCLPAQQSRQSTGASSEERRIAEVLSAMEGAGKVEVALFYETEAASAFGGGEKKRPSGAVVVAEGAGDMQVRLSLIRAMRTLLGLSETAVDVFAMEGTQ